MAAVQPALPPRRSAFLLRPLAPAAAAAGRRIDERWRWPLALGCLGLILYLLLSDNLLVTMGIPYNVPRGAFPFKIHPGSYCIALGFLLLLRGNPWRRLVQLFRLSPALTGLTLVTTAIMLYALAQFGASGAGFFIDTWLAPALLGLIVLQAPLDRRPAVFWIVLWLSAANALIGIGEAAAGDRLVPYMAGDKLLVEEFFRATALGGHPLTNALRTAVLIFVVLVLPVRSRLLLVPLFAISLLAFGSRSALASSLMLLFAWGLVSFMRGIVSRHFDPRLALGIPMAALVVPAAVAVVALSLGLGERVFQEFYWDDSAQSRLLAFQIFRFPTLDELLWGMGAARIEWALDHLKGSTTLNDIENFWILLMLQVGMIPFVFLAGSLLATLWSLARMGSTPLKLATLLFLMLASGSNSLATKTQSLAILVALLIGAAAIVQREVAAATGAAPERQKEKPPEPQPRAAPRRSGFQLLYRARSNGNGD
ncbi:MAG: VpsF family polysaccharide biosynthesis protein [Candidatus Competibacteraceae bacterium]|nr:VpsF family polysaccharide biosynthesis protein [Candidatus Competibacteraceae bacterium]